MFGHSKHPASHLEYPYSSGEITIWRLFFIFLVTILAATFIPIIQTTNVASAKSTLESHGYIVLTAGQYETIDTKLDNIATTALAAVNNADAAVTAAENAVLAAQIAAGKVDLFNSAEVFLFPSNTNTTVTLTAGNTNAWSTWAEITDGAATLSSKFATAAGYISDMYIYDHSAVDKLYLLEIAYGPSKITLGRVMYHTSFIEMAPIKSRRVPAGETIYYRLMCSGANSATAKVGFRYFFE